MMHKLWRPIVLLCLGIAALAQQPQVSNTNFRSEPVGSNLSTAVDRFQHSDKPLWIGYSVPALPHSNLSGCSNGGAAHNECCGEYFLEESSKFVNSSSTNDSSSKDLYILLRIEQGHVSKIRVANPGCQLNAGGVPFTWLNGVKPEESVRLLSKIAEQPRAGGSSHLSEESLVALALHETPQATDALVKLAAPDHDSALREHATFWLGVERGHDGFVALQKFAREDTSAAFRKKLVFALSLNSDPQATDEMVRLAKSDQSPEVRGQAIFWLAQKAGKKAASEIAEATENDPEISVKKQAVFALSQLPHEEGVPKLIHVAQTSKVPVLRKEAIFWLGQSKDAQALQFIEQVLKQ